MISQKSHFCEAYNKRNSRKDDLKKPQVCETCNIRLFHKLFLMKHLLIHTDKRFNQNSNLKNHLPIHTGVKPPICETCNER